MGEARALENRRDPAPQDRDLGRRRSVGGVRVEPEEAPLPGHVPVRVEALHAHVIEVRRPMHGGARVRLREGEETWRGRRPGVLALQRPAQDAEARALRAVLVVLAVSEEGEVVRLEPLEEGHRLVHVLAARRRGRVANLRRHVERLAAHGGPVLHGRPHLGDHALQMQLELVQLLRVGLPRHLGMDHGLGQHALLGLLAGRLGEDLEQLAVVVAAHAEHRVDDQVDPEPAPVQLHAHRIDQERHVVGHDLDGGVRGLPAVLLEARVVDAHLRGPGSAYAGEVEVPERQPIQVKRVALGHVLGRDPAIELAREGLGEIGVGRAELLAHSRAHGLGQRLLGVFDLHLLGDHRIADPGPTGRFCSYRRPHPRLHR